MKSIQTPICLMLIATCAAMSEAQDSNKALPVQPSIRQTHERETDSSKEADSSQTQAFLRLRRSGERILLKRNSSIGALALSPSGGVLAMGSVKKVSLYNLAGDSPPRDLDLPDKPPYFRVDSLCFSKSGKQLAAKTDGNSAAILLWDVESGKLERRVDSLGWAMVRGMLFHPQKDSLLVAFAGPNMVVTLRDPTQPTGYNELKFGKSVAYVPSQTGQYIVGLFDYEHPLAIRETLTGRIITRPVLAERASPRVIGFSADDKLFAYIERQQRSKDENREDEMIRIWNCETQTLVASQSPQATHYRCVSFSGDGRRLVAGTNDGLVTVWQLPNLDAPEKTFRGHSEATLQVLFTRNNDRILSSSEDGSIREWKLDGK